MSDLVLSERRDTLALVTLNRAAERNPLDRDTSIALRDIVIEQSPIRRSAPSPSPAPGRPSARAVTCAR